MRRSLWILTIIFALPLVAFIVETLIDLGFLHTNIQAHWIIQFLNVFALFSWSVYMIYNFRNYDRELERFNRMISDRKNNHSRPKNKLS